VMPDMMVLAGGSTARGFHLDGYGVFFDVEVPVLRQSMMWSLRTMLDQDAQGASEALASLRAIVATRDLDSFLTEKDAVTSEFEEAVRRRGYYPFRTTPDELSEYEGDPERADRMSKQELNIMLSLEAQAAAAGVA